MELILILALTAVVAKWVFSLPTPGTAPDSTGSTNGDSQTRETGPRPPSRKLVPVEELADRLGVDQAFIVWIIGEGICRGEKIGARWHVSEDEVLAVFSSARAAHQEQKKTAALGGALAPVRGRLERHALRMLLQEMFERQHASLPLKSSPAELAKRIVFAVWHERQEFFCGPPETRPHRISLGCFALAMELDRMSTNHPDHVPVGIVLGLLMRQIIANPDLALAGFRPIDYELLEAAYRVMSDGNSMYADA